MIRQSKLYKDLCANVVIPDNVLRYTMVSQSWVDAICGSMERARPIHGQCRKQKHANSIQSLQNAIIQVTMTVGTQWKKSSAIADCGARVAAWPIHGQCCTWAIMCASRSPQCRVAPQCEPSLAHLCRWSPPAILQSNRTNDPNMCEPQCRAN